MFTDGMFPSSGYDDLRMGPDLNNSLQLRVIISDWGPGRIAKIVILGGHKFKVTDITGGKTFIV